MKPAQQLRDDVVEARSAFALWQKEVCASRLVFVDESGFVQGQRLAYGYAPRGQRCVDYAPLRPGKRTSLIGWMASGVGGKALEVSGTVTAERFEAFVSEHLVPFLEPGDVVVWDNARMHSQEAVRLVEAVGASVRALPAYSPDMNPIEPGDLMRSPMWSKFKHIVRKARADTKEALQEAIREAARQVIGSDIDGWITHCGYQFQPT